MNNERQTPYDTGKVKIGVHYERKQPQQDGGVFADMLQTALLEPPKPLIDRLLHRLRVRHFTNV
jgi:hypothetical protein